MPSDFALQFGSPELSRQYQAEYAQNLQNKRVELPTPKVYYLN